MAAVIPLASEAGRHAVSWWRFGALAAIVVGVPLLYWPAAESLAMIWLDTGRTTYTHGFAILAISCWLLWRQRVAFSEPRPPGDARWAPIWICLLALSVLAWQLAYRAGVQIGTEMLLLAITWLAIGAFLGTRAARLAFAPVAFMGFSLTLWDAINPPIHVATVYAVRLLLRLFDVPAFFDGDVVHIPSGEFEIQGGCSGLHFLIVALAIAAFMGELRGDGWRRRLQWLLLGTALALVVNWIRVASIIYAGHVTNMQSYVVRESHYGYGWVLFAAGMFVLFLIERKTPLAALPPAAPRESGARQPPPAGSRLAVIATAVMMALPLLLNTFIERNLAGAPATPESRAHGAWTALPARTGSWNPRQLRADQEHRAAFVLGAAHVERYVALYHDQQPGKKVGGYANRPQGDGEVLERASIELDGRQFAEQLLETAGQRSVLLVTYEIADRAFDNPMRAQIWYSLTTLRSLRSPASRVIALWSPCEPDCDAARTAIHQFVDDGELH
jgi:exosortase